MIVSDLIKLLKKFPQDLPVVYELHSEHLMLEPEKIHVEDLCLAREDGWVANKRPDKPTTKYLVLPGN